MIVIVKKQKQNLFGVMKTKRNQTLAKLYKLSSERRNSEYVCVRVWGVWGMCGGRAWVCVCFSVCVLIQQKYEHFEKIPSLLLPMKRGLKIHFSYDASTS